MKSLPWRQVYSQDNSIKLPQRIIEVIVNTIGAHPWHASVIKSRMTRDEVIVSCNYILNYVGKHEKVREIACGSGHNLIWLAQNGFTDLRGYDLDDKVIHVARKIAECLQYSHIIFRIEKAFEQYTENDIAVLMAVNFLYVIHSSKSSLIDLLSFYRNMLKESGVIIADVIDSSFNDVYNNQYYTSDWNLPEEERRPSEYLFRVSLEEVVQAASQCGYIIDAIFPALAQPQKVVYVFRKI